MENEEKLSQEERERILDECMRELDEELEEHERFREWYGQRYAGKTEEERRQLEIEEYEMVYDFFDNHSELKMETEYYEDEED